MLTIGTNYFIFQRSISKQNPFQRLKLAQVFFVDLLFLFFFILFPFIAFWCAYCLVAKQQLILSFSCLILSFSCFHVFQPTAAKLDGRISRIMILYVVNSKLLLLYFWSYFMRFSYSILVHLDIFQVLILLVDL